MALLDTLKVTIIHLCGEVEHFLRYNVPVAAPFSRVSCIGLLNEILQRTNRSSFKSFRVFWVDSAGDRISLRNERDLRNYLLVAAKQTSKQAHIYVQRNSKLWKFMKMLARKM